MRIKHVVSENGLFSEVQIHGINRKYQQQNHVVPTCFTRLKSRGEDHYIFGVLPVSFAEKVPYVSEKLF